MPMFAAQHRYSHRHSPDKGDSAADVPRPQPSNVRIARSDDIRFIDKLQRTYANCVGFLPKVAVENLTEQGHIRIAMENDDPAGYILSRPALRWCPKMRSITQACVAMDAQRRHHGLGLLRVIEAEALAAGLYGIQACCAVGLDSNSFWHAAGFMPICHMRPQNVRGREIICWRKSLVTTVPLWFAQPPKLAGHRAMKPILERNANRSTDALSDARGFITSKSHT
jgi:N-acetylglutamate synthase-like GNAT family acetyltransferase